MSARRRESSRLLSSLSVYLVSGVSFCFFLFFVLCFRPSLSRLSRTRLVSFRPRCHLQPIACVTGEILLLFRNSKRNCRPKKMVKLNASMMHTSTLYVSRSGVSSLRCFFYLFSLDVLPDLANLLTIFPAFSPMPTNCFALWGCINTREKRNRNKEAVT